MSWITSCTKDTWRLTYQKLPPWKRCEWWNCKLLPFQNIAMCKMLVTFFFTFFHAVQFHFRLCARDPHQLFLRLESQVREFVIEMKVKLLKQLNSGYKTPPEAKAFIQLLLDEYGHLCVVSRKMAEILNKLVSDMFMCMYFSLCTCNYIPYTMQVWLMKNIHSNDREREKTVKVFWPISNNIVCHKIKKKNMWEKHCTCTPYTIQVWLIKKFQSDGGEGENWFNVFWSFSKNIMYQKKKKEKKVH